MRIAPHTVVLAALLALGACAPSADSPTPNIADISTADASSENARLDAWFEDRFLESVRAYPQQLTSLGMDERQDEWNNPRRSYALEQLDKSRENLAAMRELFDIEKLDDIHKLSYRLFEKNVEDNIARRKYWDHRYTYTQMRGAHSSLPTFLMNNHKIKDLEDAENYLARLETIDQPLDEHTRQAKAKFEKGIAPPKFVYGYVIESAQNILETDFRKNAEVVGEAV